MFNFIALLGWSPVGEDEIFSQEQLIEMFDPNRLSKSPAAFDAKKLEWINNQYMKKMDLDRLTEMCVPFLQKAGRIKEDLSAEDLGLGETISRFISTTNELCSTNRGSF